MTWFAKWLAFPLLAFCSAKAFSQAREAGALPYSSRNTFEVFTEGAYTSSHILLGTARNRQLGGFGGAYELRLWRTRFGTLSYRAEVLPVLFESDPYAHTVAEYRSARYGTTSYESRYKTIEKCQAGQFVYVLDSEDVIAGDTVCGRQRTFAQAFAPFGFRYAFRPGRRLQPYVSGTLGYMYSNRPIPIDNAGSLNFAFDFGPGFEWFLKPKRSVAVQYAFHHFSNNYTATGSNGPSGSNCSTTPVTSTSCEGANPGVDNMMLKVSYRFGR